MSDRCYMCAAEATTREHAPPRSFFPSGLRDGLVTVPSCTKHNNDNSADVEYVRNVIVGAYPVNEVGLSLLPKAQRSFDRSPALFVQTYRESWPALTPEGQSAIFRLDMVRFDSVMAAIAYALHCKDEGKQYGGNWGIFSPSLCSSNILLSGGIDDWAPLRKALAMATFSPLPTPQPSVFKYSAWNEGDSKLIYEFKFYDGFVVNALALPAGHNPSAALGGVQVGQQP
jgi:hypothetical protein